MTAHIHRWQSSFIVRLALLLGLFMAVSSGGAAQEQGQPAGNPVYVYLPLMSLRRTPQWLGPDGGLISAVAVDPAAHQNVYAASWGGGVYKSADGGATWTLRSQGLGNRVVVSLAIDPVNPSVLYAGTYKGKVYKTTNAAASWDFASQGIQDEAIVYSIAIDPGNTQRVYIATRGISNNGNQPWNGVIYRSDDGGASWVPKLTNLGGAGYQDYTYMIKVNPSAHNIIYAATHEHGPVKSVDYGEHWDVVANGISNLSTRAIVIDPRSAYKSTVYTGVWEKVGVFRTDDGGNSWSMMSTGITGANIYGMAIDFGRPKTVFAATYNMGVMKSTNSANSWSHTGLRDASVDTVEVDPANTQIVFAGTAGDGLYLSQDNGGAWAHSQAGLQAASVTGLVVSPDNPAVYFAAIEGGGVVWSQDRGATWSDFSAGLGDRYVLGLVKNPASQVIYALTNASGLYRCDMASPSGCWTPVGLSLQAAQPGTARRTVRPFNAQDTFFDAFNPGEPDAQAESASASSVPLQVLVFAPSDPQVAYLGLDSAGVYRSTNGGASFAPTSWKSSNVWALAVHPTNPQVVFAATDQIGTVRTSSNGGVSWTDIPLAGNSVYSLAVPPSAPNALLAGTGSGVYRWDGSNWAASGLAGQTVAALQVDPANPAVVIAGTKDGAYFSHDAGATWQPGPSELTGITVQAFGFDPADAGTLFYLTSANGILRAEGGY
jgi:hypothetical protein